MFDSLSLKQRLLGGFSIVAALLLTVAILGITQANSLNNAANFVSGPVVEGVLYSGEMQVASISYRRAILNHAMGNAEIKAFEAEQIAQYEKDFFAAEQAYAKGIFDEKERELVKAIDADFKRLVELSQPILAASNADDIATVQQLLEGEHKAVRRDLYARLEELSKINTDAAAKAAIDTDDTYAFARNVLVSASVLGFLLAIGIGLWITRAVLRQLGGDPAAAAAAVRRIAAGDLDATLAFDPSHPSLLKDMGALRDKLNTFYKAQVEMREQHDAGETDFRIDVSAYDGAYQRMAEAVNEIAAGHIEVKRMAIDLMQKYAVGDLSEDMPQLPGKKALITEAMRTTKANLSAITGDIQRLSAAAAEGDFSVRGDEAKYQFAFREMVAGLNTLMDTADAGLNEVGRVLASLAAGDLTQRVSGDFRGAFGDLAENTNATVASLADIVQRITLAVAAINTASSEIAAGNQDLSARTETQAANLEETASSMEELTATVRQNADNIRQAERVAVDATEGARRGGQVVAEVVNTMDRITAASRMIGDIIGVIDGIAFQTNILALNAAVEAARAGEQGRGFAVVAAEVRSLAQRSADAAKEVKGLIENSTAAVGEGAKLVGQAGSEITALVQSVSKVTDIMREITLATDEQRSGIEQVNETVIQLDQTTQQNAALVEEATAAARSMEDQAQGLSEMVSHFVLEETARRLVAAATAPAKPASPTRPAMVATRGKATTIRTPKAPRSIEVAGGETVEEGTWQQF